ncbi:MAG TPA: hypothetical protein VK610_03065 [Rhodothermales bacterium]|nr:hypothetical protein [Rhodothermales bacterium]
MGIISSLISILRFFGTGAVVGSAAAGLLYVSIESSPQIQLFYMYLICGALVGGAAFQILSLVTKPLGYLAKLLTLAVHRLWIDKELVKDIVNDIVIDTFSASKEGGEAIRQKWISDSKQTDPSTVTQTSISALAHRARVNFIDPDLKQDAESQDPGAPHNTRVSARLNLDDIIDDLDTNDTGKEDDRVGERGRER